MTTIIAILFYSAVALILVSLLIVGWMIATAPEGEEIPGVGFVRTKK